MPQVQSKVLLTSVFLLAATPAFAGDACRSAKDLVRLGQSFYGDNPELTNVITPNIKLAFKGINGAQTPTAILYRYEGKEDILPVVDGELTGLEKTANWSKNGEMCRMNGDEIAPKTQGNSVEANLNFSFPYKRTDGVFTVTEIKEGAKDGSKVMNGVAPSGLGFVVPGLKAISLEPAEGSDSKPMYTFFRNGETVSVKHSTLGTATFIRLKDIKSTKADVLKVEGAYQLSATFKFNPDDIAEAEAKRIAEETSSQK